MIGSFKGAIAVTCKAA